MAFGQKNGIYKAVLNKVEVQEKTTADSSGIRTDSLTNPKNNHYLYSDSTMDISWFSSATQLNFEMRNKRNETIKVIWDDASYIDTDGSTKKVFHAELNTLKEIIHNHQLQLLKILSFLI